MNWKIKRLNCATAFTLPELLVLVGIVAILAAIAVPNFMEARTSTMIAEAKDDLRALEVGLEAYRLDQSEANYPHMNLFASALTPEGSEGEATLERLTTPIAYLLGATPFLDPFEAKGVYENMTLEEYRGSELLPYPSRLANYFYTARDHMQNVQWYDTQTSPSWFLLESSGPDLIKHYMGSPLNAMGSNSEANKAFIAKIVYDPSNGTVSRGSIWNVGGSPEGRGSIVAEVIEEADSSRVFEWEQME